MKILHLYSGIGGNRKLWGNEHQITAVEFDPDIAAIYKSYFPNDKVIVADAHQFLLENYKDYDFIWSSPPCQTHSRLLTSWKNQPKFQKHIKYPDMKLYQEILFLKHWFDGKYVVENVIPYYKALIEPTIELHRHNFWTNISLTKRTFEDDRKHRNIEDNTTVYGFSLEGMKIKGKRQILRNLVNPEVGKYILDSLTDDNVNPY